MTGAAGLVGGDILLLLRKKGYRITVLQHQSQIQTEDVLCVSCDAMTDPVEDVLNGLEIPDFIIHNAGSKVQGNTAEERAVLKKINIDFSSALIRFAHEKRVKKFLFTSTLSGIKRPLPPVITEEAALDPILPYSHSKYVTEQEMNAILTAGSCCWYALRITSPLPDNCSGLPVTFLKKWLDLAREKQVLPVTGNGDRVQNFISTKDIAEAYVKILESDAESGIYNLAGVSGITMRRVAEIISGAFEVGIHYSGEEPGEIWNVSGEKAWRVLGFRAGKTPEELITGLIQSCT